jgi:hypothetical protein
MLLARTSPQNLTNAKHGVEASKKALKKVIVELMQSVDVEFGAVLAGADADAGEVSCDVMTAPMHDIVRWFRQFEVVSPAMYNRVHRSVSQMVLAWAAATGVAALVAAAARPLEQFRSCAVDVLVALVLISKVRSRRFVHVVAVAAVAVCHLFVVVIELFVRVLFS